MKRTLSLFLAALLALTLTACGQTAATPGENLCQVFLDLHQENPEADVLTLAEELLSQLRQKDVTDMAEVAYAILEPNGQISIIKKAAQKEATAADLGLEPPESGMMHLLVCDGKINRRNLPLVGWDEGRLFRELTKRKTELSEVFLLLADDGGRVALYPREAA